MTDAEKQIREALADPALFDEGASLGDTVMAVRELRDACHPAAIRALLAERDALAGEVKRRRQYVELYDEQIMKFEAEIERLRGLLCKCDMRTRLVGDGCEFCNPQLAEELARDQR